MLIEKERDYWPTTEWKQISPDSVDIDIGILSLIDKEIKGRLNGVNSFLIVKNGYIIHEKYYNGYNRFKRNMLQSVTKTIISALIGIAIDKKYQLWPFIQLDDGNYSITDKVLFNIYKQLIAEDKLNTVFYGGSVVTFQDFLSFPRKHGLYLCLYQEILFAALSLPVALRALKALYALCTRSGENARDVEFLIIDRLNFNIL